MYHLSRNRLDLFSENLIHHSSETCKTFETFASLVHISVKVEDWRALICQNLLLLTKWKIPSLPGGSVYIEKHMFQAFMWLPFGFGLPVSFNLLSPTLDLITSPFKTFGCRLQSVVLLLNGGNFLPSPVSQL